MGHWINVYNKLPIDERIAQRHDGVFVMRKKEATKLAIGIMAVNLFQSMFGSCAR